MNRKPIACPEYYPNTFERLDKAITNSFKDKKGPGTLQSSRRNINTDLMVVPCDKIEASGPCLAWGYKELAESKFQKAYIILGANNHSQTKLSTYLFADWETPLGIVKVNQEFGKELLSSIPRILNEHTAHENEHSIEVQIPWLQFASRDKLTELSFIPLAINLTSLKEIQSFAESLHEFTKKHNIPIIASCNIDDTATIQYVNSEDSEALINYKLRKRIDIKKIAPLLVLMELSKLKGRAPYIINQQQSGKNMHYACIKFV